MYSRNNKETIENMTQRYMNSYLLNYMPFSNEIKRRLAFTLAEVLITLLIIGVVASFTIPSLIANTNKAEFVTKLKKEQAILMQAFNLIKMDAGGSILNDSNFSPSTVDMAAKANAMNEFATKLNVVKNCGNGMGCWYDTPLKYLSGTTNYSNNLDTNWKDNYGKAILADGTMIMVDIFSSACTNSKGSAGTPLDNSVCGAIWIDINGLAGPNIYGRDVFVFWIAKTGLYPIGTFGDGDTCDLTSSDNLTSFGCAGKVLSEGAMNY